MEIKKSFELLTKAQQSLLKKVKLQCLKSDLFFAELQKVIFGKEVVKNEEKLS